MSLVWQEAKSGSGENFLSGWTSQLGKLPCASVAANCKTSAHARQADMGQYSTRQLFIERSLNIQFGKRLLHASQRNPFMKTLLALITATLACVVAAGTVIAGAAT